MRGLVLIQAAVGLLGLAGKVGRASPMWAANKQNQPTPNSSADALSARHSGRKNAQL